MKNLDSLISQAGRRKVAGAPEGRDALLLAELAACPEAEGGILHVARDEGRMARMAEALAFFAPDLTVLEFPGWDCVPYDRVSPHVDMVARRIDTLARLADGVKGAFVVLTTVPALAQRVPPREALAQATLDARKGSRLSMDKLVGFLAKNGYVRADTVMEPGEYAVRGGIVDLFPPGSAEPLRLDFFGDEIDSVRSFDPMSQRTTGPVEGFVCRPVSEVGLDEASIARFRTNYRELFGVIQGADPLYESISEGIKFNGMEHWLPLFHDGLDTLFAYLPEAAVVLDHQSDEALTARHALVLEYFDARAGLAGAGLTESGMVYHPIAPERLYLERDEWDRLLAVRPVLHLSPFDAVEDGAPDAGGRLGRDFADMRARPGVNVYDCVREHAEEQAKAGRRVVIAAWTNGSRDRLAGVLKDHGVKGIEPVESWAEAKALDKGRVAVAVLGLDHGFVTPELAVITEQDILGDRLARPARKKKKGAQFIAEASALAEGDLVVHVEHGIGRYDGLVALEVSGAPHDCLRVIYDGGDKLFVPVENIDVLTRFGSEQAGVSLDKLGGTAWQARKAKLKKRIRDIADQLIGIAAQRKMRQGEALVPAEGLYDEFCARFPFAETEDQLRAIEDSIADLASGKPMDRLICGDVGFGKTEVAMRVAFVAALQGLQVAVVVPTTLLARQHYRTFKERFAGLPVRVEQLSRLVTAKTASEVKAGVADGSVDIVVGTHALLAKGIGFKRLGLLIIDEEQHFGVAHKERLKQLKADVHVLTLTATPIPRTLQMALSGVKEMSVIATPPIDRLAVRTFVLPYDPVVLRESILRERYRGGQVFYVCPRLADIDRVAERLAKLVPEVKTAVAHGRLAPADLEEVMVAFGDKQYDVLLSTNIIESGIDMPSVNTLIIHRADMFGLGQLYQLRGRVGRGKTRGYAYFTLPNDKVLSKAAEKRLQVMQALDTLGAGFQLASHDLDIRGAGNLLGEEQSGHIREVGVELYQQLLEEAVAAAKGGQGSEAAEEWSPQIAVGTPVLIPETYVADLSVRLSLYRRIGSLSDQAEIEALAAELIDRFGTLPPEVENLLEVVAIKALCKLAGIDKVDSGPKGAVVSLRGNVFANPGALVQFIARSAGSCKIRPDHKIVFLRAWEDPKQRIVGLRNVIGKLAELAAA
ncbi:Transcription-repair coupling factor [Paramagnetospirillum magnetotacticum MS-1]|uniref:Transcription-repair-coupling factor n=1 Tax=Paramagnetospirillum magnetotacticum MS-1 TaxID=272627 RepID=A0A0C2UBK1_PARME|nr:transcription-repair coupling factor [Paramagnetospirillum magnetotacticum]KIL98872.1 Transcription-repair coupling factor [Paramagnetospirillum magnetotacticum MS-1]